MTAGLPWVLRSCSVALGCAFVVLGEQVEGVERDLHECYTFALGERNCLPARCLASAAAEARRSPRRAQSPQSSFCMHHPACCVSTLTAIKCNRCSQHSNASHTRLKVGVVALKVARQHPHAEGAVLGRELWGADGLAQGLVALAGRLEGFGVWGLGFRV